MTAAPGQQRRDRAAPPIGTGRWSVATPTVQALVVGVIGATVAVLTSRPDLLVVSAPLLVVVAWSLAHRPEGSIRATSRLRDRRVAEGRPTALDLRWTACPQAATAAFTSAQDSSTHGAGLVLPLCPGQTSLVAPLDAGPWGHRRLGDGSLVLLSGLSAYRCGPIRLMGGEAWVMPHAAGPHQGIEAPRPQGLVGAHRSHRVGEGVEFAEIRQFTPGDRLRRIHWPISARTGQLHVRTAYAERDAEIHLVVDATAEVGRDGDSSLDRAVRTSIGLAEQLLSGGDRIGLHVLGTSPPTSLPARSGRNHLQRVRLSLCDLRRHSTGGRPLPLRLGQGAQVLIASPLLTDETSRQAAELSGRGASVVVLDCLPQDDALQLARDERGHVAALAWRLRRLERQREIEGLARLGISVVPADSPGALTTVVRMMRRHPTAGARR